LLGYRDSGMEGWDTNNHPDAFANVPVDVAAAKLAVLIERYRPQVVVTYDEKGGYGHPDHVQAHRIAVAAVALTDIPDKLYYTAIPRSWMRGMAEYMRESGVENAEEWEIPEEYGTPDELITAMLDVSAYAERKVKAIQAHGSQGDSAFILGMPDELQRVMFSGEAFLRQRCKVDAPDREDDLFAGLR
jgi:LmbE family N-acetylglucosaminyl deacetylase